MKRWRVALIGVVLSVIIVGISIRHAEAQQEFNADEFYRYMELFESAFVQINEYEACVLCQTITIIGGNSCEVVKRLGRGNITGEYYYKVRCDHEL